MTLLALSASSLEQAQRRRDERLAWLRSLKTGDAVALVRSSARHGKTTERTIVRVYEDGDKAIPDLWVVVEKYPRRNLRADGRLGEWRRNGKDWEEMRIDPI